MYLCIQSVLDPDTVSAVRKHLGSLKFADGAATAGWHAKTVKRNLQADGTDAAVKGLREDLFAAVSQNAMFVAAARPRRFGTLLLSRYDAGMEYGLHVDDAVMRDRDGAPMRTDVSFTLFLSDEDSYDGGALVIDSPLGEQPIRLPAGSLVLYPSTTLHRVEPVTRGTRFAAVGWLQSLVRDAGQRELLFDLETARMALFRQSGKSAEFDLISKSLTNLLRLWVET